MKKKIVFIALVLALTFSAVGMYGQDFEIRGTTLVDYNGRSTNVTIPSNITVIGKNAFLYDDLTSVTIPNGVTAIEEGAFMGNKLTSVTIPNSVISIGKSAFWENQLTSVSIGSGVTTIGENAFMANQLKSVTIPDSVTTIEESAFQENQLSSITIGSKVTIIGEWVFYKNQLANVTIPNSVTSIGAYAFNENNLTSITIPNSVKTIGRYAFDDNKVTSVVIGANVTLGMGAFGNRFEDFYESSGKKADTYTYDGRSWSAKNAPASAAVQPEKAAFDRGRAAYDQKNYDRAITEFTEAIRLNPNYELAYYYRAETYVLKNDYDKALADFDQAIRLSPNDDDNFSERGYVYILKNDYDRAIADFNQALRINPDNEDAKEGLEAARKRKQNSSPMPAWQPPAPAPTANAGSNFIPPSAWASGDGDAEGVTKKIFKTREVIAGQERDVLTLEVTFPRQKGGKWATYSIPYDEPYQSKLRTGSGIRFKALGDGKRWILQVQTKDTSSDWCGFEAEIKTVNNRVVDINIPYSSLKQGTWGKKAPWVKSNILGINIQRNSATDSESGASTLKIFDFEIY